MKLRLTIPDIYKTYNYPKDSPYYVTAKEYKQIMDTFCILLVKYMVNTGGKYKIPGGLGDLFVRRNKQVIERGNKYRRVDFGATKKLGMNIYHQNKHSNGYYARFKWDKSKVYVVHKHTFKFNATRWAKRYLAQQIKKENTIVKYSH